MGYIKLKRFPFSGTFYDERMVDESGLSNEIERIVLYDGECNISEGGDKSNENIVKAGYTIRIPLDKDTEGNYIFKLQKGHFFEGIYFGQRVNGKVAATFATQFGFAKAYIVDKDVEL